MSVGLALSGGTLKAAAHIGVLEALELVGVRPDVIAGTSAGSLVSTLYAHGYRTEQFRQLLARFPGLQLLDYGFPLMSSIWSLAVHRFGGLQGLPPVPTGVVRGHKLTAYIERLISRRRVQIPLYVVATDLRSGRPVVFSFRQEDRYSDLFIEVDDIPRAVTGSCALPGIFSPVPFDDYLLVDGAMRHYVPVSVLERVGCKKIIAVNLYRLPPHYEPRTIVDVLARSFDILLRESIDNDMVPGSHVYVLEPDVSGIRWRKFSQMTRCVDIGRKLVEDNRMELTSFLNM